MAYTASWKRSALVAGGISAAFGVSLPFLQPEFGPKDAAYIAVVTAAFSIPVYYAMERFIGVPLTRLSGKIGRGSGPTTLDIYKKG